MYKLIIVDDEFAIRRGMCNFIPWNEMGFDVVADFEDGKETINYIEQNKVDAIITDIEMAEVTGLDLSKYIYEKKLDIKVVILSGYKVFEYARKAVEYNVQNYILKPINLNEVRDVFSRIKKDLDHKKDKNEFLIYKQKNFEKILLELQEQFFVSLLMGGFHNEEKVVEKAKLLKLDIKLDNPYALIDFKLEYCNQEEQFQSRQDLIHTLLSQKNSDFKYYVANLSNRVTKIIATRDDHISVEDFSEKLEQELNNICQMSLKLLHLNASIVIEDVFKSLNSFMDRKYMFQMRIEKHYNKTKLLKEDNKRLVEKYKLLIEYINDGDFDALDGLVDNIFYEFRNIPLEHVKNLIIDMFSLLSTKFMKMGSELWMEVNKKVKYQDIMTYDNRNELKENCKELLNYAVSILNNVQNDTTKQVVEKATIYIKDNCGEDLSLDTIADKFFLNPSYFSRLFKQYTGSTYTEYLLSIRMEKAKELIALGSYKMYEVGKLVGYHSEKYFFRVFKQNTGISPTEYYRKRVLKDE